MSGVCFDYACLFKTFMNEQNIPCLIAWGDVIKGKETVLHNWNYVWIDYDDNGKYEWKRIDTCIPYYNDSMYVDVHSWYY
jgi:transglutaminase/protease-like cytokinesis protein 3